MPATRTAAAATVVATAAVMVVVMAEVATVVVMAVAATVVATAVVAVAINSRLSLKFFPHAPPKLSFLQSINFQQITPP